MKTLLIRAAVLLGLAVISVSAQTQSAASGSTSYIETSKFIGKKVKSPQGDEIGTVKDIVLDRNTGCLAYTVVSTAGGGGTRVSGGGKMVAVPWAVYSPSSDLNVLTVTVDRDRVYNAPAFDYARIDEYSRPEYITNIYSYYGVSGGAAGVGVSGSATTGTTTTTGASTTTGAATTSGAAGSGAAAAGASQGQREAAGETPSRGAQPSPAPRSTPAATPRTQPARTHATASPSARGREAGSPPTRRMRGSTDTESRSENERPEREQQSSQTETNAPTRESRAETEQTDSGQSGAAERTSGTRHRAKPGKRETSSPPEQPEER